MAIDHSLVPPPSLAVTQAGAPQPGADERLPFAATEVDGSVATRFEQVVAWRPERRAVETAAGAWTYAALNQEANRVARGLLDLGGLVWEPVAVLMSFDRSLIAVILGILKAGKCVTVLDPDHPTQHVQTLLDDLDARWLIFDPDHADLARQVASDRRVAVSIEELGTASDTGNPGLTIPTDTPAVITYTSGSTGRSKGVIRTQNLTLFRAWIDHHQLGVGPDDRIASLVRPVFAGPFTDLMQSLLNGATLLPFDARYHSVDALTEWLIRVQPTLLRPPLALLRQMLGALEEDQVLPTLRLVELGSDLLYRQDVLRLRRHVQSGCVFVHRYVTSETGMTAWMVIDPDRDLDGETIPVGYPAPGRAVLIVDEQRRPVEPGQVGEIVVRGRNLSPGYWRRPQLTAERFAPDPDEPGVSLYYSGDRGRLRPDGRLEFAGRSDWQIKIRGNTVNLATVESALLDLPDVNEAAVLALPGPSGERRIVAYVVLKDQGRPVNNLRDALARVLPAPMRPSVLVSLDALPQTANGKVDRRALPLPDRSRPSLGIPFVAPRTATEVRLAGIWATALGLDSVGVHDPFMDLGGDSLLAAQVIGRINRVFQTRQRVRDLFQAATIAEMAALLEVEAVAGLAEQLPLVIEQIEQLSEAEAERLLRREERGRAS